MSQIVAIDRLDHGDCFAGNRSKPRISIGRVVAGAHAAGVFNDPCGEHTGDRQRQQRGKRYHNSFDRKAHAARAKGPVALGGKGSVAVLRRASAGET